MSTNPTDLRSDGVRQNIRDELDIALSRTILGALEEATEALGRPPTPAELGRALARGRAVAEGAADAPRLAGLLGDLRPGSVREMIEVLEERGYARAGERGRLALSQEGRSYARGFLPAPTGVTGRVLDRPAGGLPAALRKLRLDLARAAGIPAYRVYPDRTLRAIAARRPGTLAELLLVPGIGPATAARYGPAMLETLARATAHAEPTPPASVSPPSLALGEPRPVWRHERPRHAASRTAGRELCREPEKRPASLGSGQAEPARRPARRAARSRAAIEG